MLWSHIYSPNGCFCLRTFPKNTRLNLLLQTPLYQIDLNYPNGHTTQKWCHHYVKTTSRNNDVITASCIHWVGSPAGVFQALRPIALALFDIVDEPVTFACWSTFGDIAQNYSWSVIIMASLRISFVCVYFLCLFSRYLLTKIAYISLVCFIFTYQIDSFFSRSTLHRHYLFLLIIASTCAHTVAMS